MSSGIVTFGYDLADYPGTCCGLGELGNFCYGIAGLYADPKRRIPLGDPSRVDEHIKQNVIDMLVEGNGEDDLENQYLLNAYVSDDTPKECRQYFKDSSVWEETRRWVNVKTGNQITAYSWLIYF